MKALTLRFISICLLTLVALTGCGSKSLEFVRRLSQHENSERHLPGHTEQRRLPDCRPEPKVRIGSHPQRWNS